MIANRWISDGRHRSRGAIGSSVVIRQRHRRVLALAAGDTDLAGVNRCPKWVRNMIADPGVPLTPAATPQSAGEPEMSGGAFTASMATAIGSAAIHSSGCQSS